jgi:hypothetical protein
LSKLMVARYGLKTMLMKKERPFTLFYLREKILIECQLI